MTLRIEITSAEKEIYSGSVSMVFVTGEMGELGIAPGHAPLLTSIKPGNVRVLTADQKEEVFYISSGMLEVQPFTVTVLADTAIRATDIDEAAALQAKERAENALADQASDIDVSKATVELAEAIAQIQAINKLRKKAR